MADADRPPSFEDPVEDRLPLTPAVFDILMSLSDGPSHGYAIMREVEARSASGRTLLPGTLYRAIHRLLEDGLIRETDDAEDGDGDDARRRTYELTPLGRRVAEAEAARLAAVVDAARAKELIGDGAVAGKKASS